MSENANSEHGDGKLRELAARMAALHGSAGFPPSRRAKAPLRRDGGQPAGSGGILPPVSHFRQDPRSKGRKNSFQYSPQSRGGVENTGIFDLRYTIYATFTLGKVTRKS